MSFYSVFRPIKSLSLLVFILLIMSGCSYFNETRLENSLGRDINLVDFSYNIADDLIDNAFPPLLPRHPEMPLLLTTFVDNNDLEQTSHFGRLLQEHIGSRLVHEGYTVKEIKLRKELVIEERSGETILSRRRNLLQPEQNAQAILVGTISMAQRTMYINARLVNPIDASIISSNSYRLYMDKNVLAMFNLKVSGDTNDIAEPAEPFMNKLLF